MAANTTLSWYASLDRSRSLTYMISVLRLQIFWMLSLWKFALLILPHFVQDSKRIYTYNLLHLDITGMPACLIYFMTFGIEQIFVINIYINLLRHLQKHAVNISFYARRNSRLSIGLVTYILVFILSLCKPWFLRTSGADPSCMQRDVILRCTKGLLTTLFNQIV